MIHATPLNPVDAASSLALFRQQSPLVHCMTNDVVQTFTANVLLALGASPAMVIEAEEAAQFSAIANALLVNVGTLTRSRSEAMFAAVESSNRAGRSWTLDPVAARALDFRTAFCHLLLSHQPAAIRGNASEIMALANEAGGGRGVDTLHQSSAAIHAAQTLATESGAIVAVSGEVDFITDGQQVISVSGGSPLMTRVVGTGCSLSAVVAAFASLPGDRLTHVATACKVFAVAGEHAVARSAGPGSFIPAFLDELYQLTPEKL